MKNAKQEASDKPKATEQVPTIEALAERVNKLERALMKTIDNLSVHTHDAQGRAAVPLA